MRDGVRRLGTILALLAPSSAWAQLAPVGVAAGAARLEVDGAFEIWDNEFVDGHKRPVGARITTPALGSSLIPSLAPSDALIRSITGISDYQLSLGGLTGDVISDRGTAVFGASIGLTHWLTIFGRIPLVRARVQTNLDFDTTADAGVTPSSLQQDPFFQEFDNAINTLGAQISSGFYDGDPAQRALAEATLASGTTLRDNLFLLLADPETASPFVPVASSVAGGAITQQVTALQGTLSGSLGVAGFTATPVLPTTPVTGSDVEAFLNAPGGPVSLSTGESVVTFRGDAEAGAAITLVDGWDRGTKRGGLRAAVEGLVRFPTGSIPRSNQLLALGTGDGQTDVEVRGTLDVGTGAIGARLEAGYNRQLAADYVDRVAAPTEPFAGLDRLANIRRDPGDVTTLGVRPFVRLARTFALIGQVELQSRQLDKVTYASEADSIPGVDPSVLAEGTDGKATYVGIGVSYSNPGVRHPGGRGLPVDAGWTYERVVSSSRGIVPDVHRIRARFRLYFGLF
ncbi:MAG: hypothetical protein ACAI18_12820 [Gemmatimonadales bacterium]